MKQIDMNEYFHLGKTMKMTASNPELNVKSLTGGQKSKRVPSYRWTTNMFDATYNPDELNYNDYQEMLRDPQIKAAERLIVYSLLSKKFHITPASERPEDVEIADFVREVFNNLKTPFRQVRKDLYSAITFGFAVSEVNYEFVDYIGKIVIESIRGVDIETLWRDCFTYDQYGNVKTVTQTIGLDKISIPGDKCIIFAFDELFGNKYGRSILRACYDDHFMKHQILIWAAIFLEKHEGPTVVGYESELGSNSEEMQKNIDSIHEGTAGFTAKPGEKYEILESQHRGEAFMQFINYHDNMIFRTFLIGSLLLGQAEAHGGSLAQSQTHDKTLGVFLDGIHQDLANSIQEAIRNLVDLNFVTRVYPKFEFESFEEKELLSLLSALQPYADKFMIDKTSSWFFQLLKRIMDEYADIEITEEEFNLNNNHEFPLYEGNAEEEEIDNSAILDGVKEILKPTSPTGGA
jgi:hypothetical protein